MKRDPNEALVRLCASDLLEAFKMPKALHPLAWAPAARFAAALNRFDEAVGSSGIASGGSLLVGEFSGGADWRGQEKIPLDGPLIVASNHPGMCDAMTLWMAIGREDLMVIAADRELLRLLPNTYKRLIIVQGHSGGALRQASQHLDRGGSLLTFPAGGIEPDPLLRAGGIKSLETWSSSLELLARRTPSVQIIPALVSGVLSQPALASPLIKWIKDPRERDWAGATLQILFKSLRKNRISLTFGDPTGPRIDQIRQAMKDLWKSNPELLE